MPFSGNGAVPVASAPTSLNGAHQTIPEQEDDCDIISGQLSATVESMLCGASDAVCCATGGEILDVTKGKEDYLAANKNYLESTQPENGGDGVDQVRSAPPSPSAESARASQRPRSLQKSTSSPLARQSSTLSSKASYRRNKGSNFSGYDDHQLFQSIRWKMFMDS